MTENYLSIRTIQILKISNSLRIGMFVEDMQNIGPEEWTKKVVLTRK